MGEEADKLTRRGDAASGGAHGKDETRACLAQVPSRETAEAEGQLMTAVIADAVHAVNVVFVYFVERTVTDGVNLLEMQP